MIDTSMHAGVLTATSWAEIAMQDHEDSHAKGVHTHMVEPINRDMSLGETFTHACIECAFSLSIFTDETDTMLFIRRPA